MEQSSPFFISCVYKMSTILVRNIKQRVFNGVRPYQIVEIAEKNLFMYKSAWFEVYTETSVDTDDTINDNTIVDLNERMDFLAKQGVEVKASRKDATIIKKSDELGYVLQPKEPTTIPNFADLEPPVSDINDWTDAEGEPTA